MPEQDAADGRAEETIDELQDRLEELHEGDGGGEGALQCCDLILARDPKNMYAHHVKAEIFEERGRFEEALKCHEAALRNNPSDELAVSGKVYCLLNQDKNKEAREFTNAQLVENRGSRDVLLEMEHVLRKMGQHDSAAKCSDAAAKIKSGR